MTFNLQVGTGQVGTGQVGKGQVGTGQVGTGQGFGSGLISTRSEEKRNLNP